MGFSPARLEAIENGDDLIIVELMETGVEIADPPLPRQHRIVAAVFVVGLPADQRRVAAMTLRERPDYFSGGGGGKVRKPPFPRFAGSIGAKSELVPLSADA